MRGLHNLPRQSTQGIILPSQLQRFEMPDLAHPFSVQPCFFLSHLKQAWKPLHSLPFAASFYIIEGYCHVSADYILSRHPNRTVAFCKAGPFGTSWQLGAKIISLLWKCWTWLCYNIKKTCISPSHKARTARNLRNLPYCSVGKITAGSPLVISICSEYLVGTHPDFLPFCFKWNQNFQSQIPENQVKLPSINKTNSRHQSKRELQDTDSSTVTASKPACSVWNLYFTAVLTEAGTLTRCWGHYLKQNIIK